MDILLLLVCVLDFYCILNSKYEECFAFFEFICNIYLT